MSLELVVRELGDRLWQDGDESAALALQALAWMNTEAGDTAWNVLVHTLMEGSRESAEFSGKALAYYCLGGEEEVERVFDVFRDAVLSPSLDARKAGLKGVNQAARLSPEAAERKTTFSLWLIHHEFDEDLQYPTE